MISRRPLLSSAICLVAACSAVSLEARVLEVNQKGGADFATLTAAAAVAQPGDTISIAQGSGPYREILRIKESGAPDAPITVEGNGETITGFDPLTNFREENGVWVADLPVPFPCVITYRGERLLQDNVTGEFTRYARLSEDQKRLELLPGTERDSWEVSTRLFAVQILDVSHHLYRNLKASGSRNDGFNLHGTGEDLVFENIQGFQNQDEGFSAHDDIKCEIRNGEFRWNDNGLLNVAASTMKAENLLISDNLGFGLCFFQCSADLRDVNIWDNGVAQIFFGKDTEITCTDVIAYHPTWTARPWKSYGESGPARMNKPILLSGKSLTGEPQLLEANQAPRKLDSAKND